MNQYRIEGALTYLLYCPKAPELDAICETPAACPGHQYHVETDVYVIAPDENRAVLQALAKLKGAYPWGYFDDAPPSVRLCLRPAQAVPAGQKGPMLPGFESFGGFEGSATP